MYSAEELDYFGFNSPFLTKANFVIMKWYFAVAFFTSSHKLIKGEKYKFITMHSSRRSYVSCLAANGVPISTISKLAGHGSTAMTDRYVCVDTHKLGEDAMQFFNR